MLNNFLQEIKQAIEGKFKKEDPGKKKRTPKEISGGRIKRNV